LDTRVDLTVFTSSVDMNDREQTDILRSADFFDVDRFPTMHFVSAAAALAPDRK
jgi:polyisoprenoid-binding protein YceI